MHSSLCFLFSVAIVATGVTQAAQAQDAGDTAVYVVTYVDVMPPAKDDGIALLRQYREASRKDDGNVRCEVLQQRHRPNQFAIVEAWKNPKAFETHGTAPSTVQFRERLQGLHNSPNDERVHTGFSVGATQTAPAGAALYVLTHVDVIPPRKDDAVALLKQLSDDSRKDDGNMRYEVLQQASRLNHFTVVEMWRDQQAFEAHAMATHTRQFRQQLQPMSGSLYDERLYQILD